jgi:hypothetical protein
MKYKDNINLYNFIKKLYTDNTLKKRRLKDFLIEKILFPWNKEIGEKMKKKTAWKTIPIHTAYQNLDTFIVYLILFYFTLNKWYFRGKEFYSMTT